VFKENIGASSPPMHMTTFPPSETLLFALKTSVGVHVENNAANDWITGGLSVSPGMRRHSAENIIAFPPDSVSLQRSAEGVWDKK